MRMFYSHPNFYNLYRQSCKAQSYSERSRYREGLLKKWAPLKRKGLSDQDISHTLEISRATFYRHRKLLRQKGLQALERRSRRPRRVRQSKISRHTRELILKLREDNPTYGKIKIRRLLERDHGVILSESSVGRILSDYMKQGKITKYQAAKKIRKKRGFNRGYAAPWHASLKATQPGEMIQIDHMSVSKNQTNFKEFHAWDPVTKTLAVEAYSNATSQAAACCLEKVIADYPFKVGSIQVDGGSEFRKHFEQLCETKGIPLYVLPPASPKLNGGVERTHRTLREDLYANKHLLAHGIEAFRGALKKAVKKYNEYRPHQALNGLTPFEYTRKILGANLSQNM